MFISFFFLFIFPYFPSPSLAKGLLCFHESFYLTRQRKVVTVLPDILALLRLATKGTDWGQQKLWPGLFILPSVLERAHVAATHTSVLWSAMGN